MVCEEDGEEAGEEAEDRWRKMVGREFFKIYDNGTRDCKKSQ